MMEVSVYQQQVICLLLLSVPIILVVIGIVVNKWKKEKK